MDQAHPVIRTSALVRHLKLSVLPQIVAAPDRLASYGRFEGLTDPARAVISALEASPLQDIYSATDNLAELLQRPDDRLPCQARRVSARLVYAIEGWLTSATTRAQVRASAQRLTTLRAQLPSLLDNLNTQSERLRSRSAVVRASVQAAEEFLLEPITPTERLNASESPLSGRSALRHHVVDLKASAKSHDDAIRLTRQAQASLDQVQAALGSALGLVPAWLQPLPNAEAGSLEQTRATILRRLKRSNTTLAALLQHPSRDPKDPPSPGSAWQLSAYTPRRDPRTQMVLDEQSPPSEAVANDPRARCSLAVVRFEHQALC